MQVGFSQWCSHRSSYHGGHKKREQKLIHVSVARKVALLCFHFLHQYGTHLTCHPAASSQLLQEGDAEETGSESGGTCPASHTWRAAGPWHQTQVEFKPGLLCFVLLSVNKVFFQIPTSIFLIREFFLWREKY